MKEIIRNPIFWVGCGMMLIGTACWYVGEYCTEIRYSTGTVIEHNTASDRNGRIDYYTVVLFEDGTIRSIRGLRFYVRPVGSEVKYGERVFK